ncbi:adenosylcobinamide-GDP ribazoletransferase [Microbispora sp. NPDC049125]|uniref:adenosylcobinamide-GDP ribazoletransferase n=1 Tax=Microbispora sp. NPDC049125 TaxID=3154929 RepID=UPI0034678C65
MGAAWRLTVGMFTIVPVRVDGVDRDVAGRAMVLAPLAGVGLGLVAAVVLTAAGRLSGSPLLAAVLALATLAWLTRALHLDGLADLADGLGSGKPAQAALDVMKRSDIGPFGVVTLVLTLLVQVAALTQAQSVAGPAAATALPAACAAGRLAVTWACREGVPAARPGGLGALVAGTVRRGPALAATAATAALLAAAGALTGLPYGEPVRGLLTPLLALGAGPAAAWLLRRRAVRRLGGVTGDVLGALIETSTTAALLVYAVT